jgi:HK97 family phage prohead protease
MATYRGQDIDLSIPQAVKRNAQRGLDLAEEFGRGGTDVGRGTARYLVREDEASPEKVRQIARYWPRHDTEHVNEDGSDGEPPSNAYIAWQLWGGDEGRAWSERKRDQLDRIDEEQDKHMPRERERKTFMGGAAVKEVSGRTVTGVASVLGNRDDYGDIIWPGAYAKTIQEGRRRMRHFWQHSWSDMLTTPEPPTAVIDDIREVGRGELPDSVLSAAPDALGGLLVTRTYLNTLRGNEILEGIKAGAITEMSIGYEAIVFDYDESDDGRQVRNLREIRLLETSDVIWGANAATVASKNMPPLGTILDALEGYAKAGRRNNEDDQRRINDICRLAYELGADYAPDMPDDDDDRWKAQSPMEAEPEHSHVPPLTLQRRLRALELRLTLQEKRI